jgi:hypothetical protein
VTWEWADNPAYAGRMPSPLEASCHDRSPFLTITCSCGAEMHIHETQIAQAPRGLPMGATCKGCGELLMFEPG